MVIMRFDFKSLQDKIKNSLLLHLKQKEKKRERHWVERERASL